MEDFENTYIGKLWYILLSDDKRSFNEYFSEEHGITLDDDITDAQICFLCKAMMRLNDKKLIQVDSIREYQNVNHWQIRWKDKLMFLQLKKVSDEMDMPRVYITTNTHEMVGIYRYKTKIVVIYITINLMTYHQTKMVSDLWLEKYLR